MEGKIMDSVNDSPYKKSKKKFDLLRLRKSLKFRPEIFKLILSMRQCVKRKNLLLKQLKHQLKIMEQALMNNDKWNESVNSKENISTQLANTIEIDSKTSTSVKSTQTDDITVLDNSHSITHPKLINKTENTVDNSETGWNLNESDNNGKSIAEQVKEVAQSALQESGMVYVESAGMYYDYKTGYYYNSELKLYYHTDTGCYYYYSEEKKELVFHSYPDRSVLAANASLEAHVKRKARKQKQAENKNVDDITKNFSKEEDKPPKAKRKKRTSKKNLTPTIGTEDKDKDKQNSVEKPKTGDSDNVIDVKTDEGLKESEDAEMKEDLEDGECSETASEDESDMESDASTSTASDEDTVAKHHPPCMRVIIRETNLPKLKVGSLFLITKDGGSVGREGDHAILLRDTNVSRNHLEIKYDMAKRVYTATDLGSKNGTLLNGVQMSESQVVSQPMEVVHGSILQFGETKLLCHIHSGNDTCGHCEPGLLMETQEKEKAAYTRTCNVQKQYHLELARLKNKYGPESLMIEEGTYNDRAKARRDAVGSSHHAEKTEATDVDTCIAPENKGFKLLEKMGWSKGEGLGRDNQGDVNPIPLVSNEGKAGLGTPGAVVAPNSNPAPKKRNQLGEGTLRLAARSKLLQPPAKAFQLTEDDDED